MKKIFTSLFYLFFPILVGGIVGFLISSKMDYSQLVKPVLAPPSLTFPIVWTIIYLLMGISYYLWKKNTDGDECRVLYYTQLFVNALWAIIFFVFKWRFFSILWIVLLDFLIYLLLRCFYRQYRISSYINIPYFLWSLFATYLTIGIYLLN